MDMKQWCVLIAGVTGLSLVVACPLWFYPPHPLMPQETRIGYRFITEAPASQPVVKVVMGQKYVQKDQKIVARIDAAELAARIGLIIAITLCGLWILRARKSRN